MGRDNHPRMRQEKSLARKNANRDSYDRILIVCEGKKTEPLYFEGIRTFYRLHTANIRVLQSEYGTAPQQIVDFAKDECLKTKQWEQVYCVFDRDDHLNFQNAINSTVALNNKHRNDLKKFISFKAIPSIPCFELWLLLHFRYISHEIHRMELFDLLKKPECLPGYEKGQTNLFLRTKTLLETAYSNAAKLKEECKKNEKETPYTEVDSLVRLLTGLKPLAP